MKKLILFAVVLAMVACSRKQDVGDIEVGRNQFLFRIVAIDGEGNNLIGWGDGSVIDCQRITITCPIGFGDRQLAPFSTGLGGISIINYGYDGPVGRLIIDWGNGMERDTVDFERRYSAADKSSYYYLVQVNGGAEEAISPGHGLQIVK